MKEAAYYTSLSDKKVECLLCPHHCRIADGKQGICLTRQNQNGTLYAANFCRPVSTAIDPIEKKPLYHFHPGTTIFSAGPNGCTLKCKFCQNYSISQDLLPTHEKSVGEFVAQIQNSNSTGIAYTYSEPYIWFETIMAIGPKIKEMGMVNVMVTNGYMEQKPLDDLLTVVDAMNIDIKSMDQSFYQKLCKGDLAPVLRTCETVKKKCHLEITNLLITGQNDSEEAVERLVDYIAKYLGKDTPLHISRYFPRYKMDTTATPEDSLLSAWELAKSKLDYVYLGNIWAEDKSNTTCPSCQALLINRSGYSITITENLHSQSSGICTCKICSTPINVTV